MTDPEAARLPIRVTVGICAYNEEGRIGRCLASVLAEGSQPRATVVEILVAASGCTDGTERVVEEWAARDPRITLLRETTRRGKASALNLILSHARGDLVAFVNGDAVLQPGSLARLLAAFEREPGLLVACGAPLPESNGARVPNLLARLQWQIHNRALELCSARNLPNHCCDEFMVLRSGVVDAFPADLINDGAFVATVATSRGQTVRFCPDAIVGIEIPHSVRGILMQRRRILRGHRQVEGLLHRPTNTLGALVRHTPGLALGIVLREGLESLSSLFAFAFLMLPIEATASALAAFDGLLGRPYEGAWPAVD